MIAPAVEKSFDEALKRINPGLYLIWNKTMERFQVFYRDHRNGLVRIICTVEDDDGESIPCDNRTLNFLRDVVAWDTLGKFPEPKEMVETLRKKSQEKLKKEKMNREDFMKWWNKEHRTMWKAAFENMKRGIVWLPEEKKTKIYSTARTSKIILTDNWRNP